MLSTAGTQSDCQHEVATHQRAGRTPGQVFALMHDLEDRLGRKKRLSHDSTVLCAVAVIVVGKVRVVSLSQTALQRRETVAHVALEYWPDREKEIVIGGIDKGYRSEISYMGMPYETACGKTLLATREPTFQIPNYIPKTKPLVLRYQTRRPCGLCRPQRPGGELSYRISPPERQGPVLPLLD